METNPLETRMKAHLPLQRAAALLRFTQTGVAQKLLHQLKYHHRPEIGQFLGRLGGQKFAGHPVLKEADCIVPVPLHPAKQKQRGYNQSMMIASGLNEACKIEIQADLIVKTEASNSQTRKNRLSRWENIRQSFALDPRCQQDANLRNRHFLVVDDVVTTGATAISCCRELLQLPGARVSFFAVAHPE